MPDYDAIKTALEGIAIEDNPRLVQMKSRDFYWYSPVLKSQLDGVTGDLVVSPQSEEEVIRVLKVAYAHGVPVTARGTGTGNYGQAMPLSGGIVLNMANMNRVKEIHVGRVICEAGIVMAKLDEECRAQSGQELRFHPSTHKTATVGGFVAGGSGGVGSITWGGLRDFGNILRLRIVTMEAEPRVLELTGLDLHKVAHAYGTNGIITEVEMPLAPAYDWIDALVGFDDFMEAAKFADLLARQNGILLKELAVIAAPTPHLYFSRHKKWLREGQSVVALMVAPMSVDAFAAFCAMRKAEVMFRSDLEADLKGVPDIYELCWNHTTLRAIKVEPSFTYLQVQYASPDHLAKVARTVELFGDEVIGHLEFIKFDGEIQCAGLPLVRYTTEERLEEIIRLHEDNGCPIFNPHRYTLEEGGHEANRHGAARLQARDRSQGVAQSRQDDCLGKSRLRLQFRPALPVSRSCRAGSEPMKVLLLFSHPVETSFGAAVHETARAALEAAGHEVDDSDLYAEGFDPVLSRRDRLTYHSHPENMELVADHCRRLERAEALVIVTPIWNFGFPAILKGYFDRVWLPGVSFDLVEGKVQSKLQHIRKVVACFTYGSAPMLAFLSGNPPRKIVKRGDPGADRSTRQLPLHSAIRHESQQPGGPRPLSEDRGECHGGALIANAVSGKSSGMAGRDD